MTPWYRVVTPRKEVREGRSFNPDEFAIALEQVVAGTAPEDYRDPQQFFARTYFTRALREHAGLVLRRLAGRTDNTAPVLTLITQFGGGKTHTLTVLYHLAKGGEAAAAYPGIPDLLREAGLPKVPGARVAVFVGNAWDPREGRENPWIDLARQLAGDRGIEALGEAARTVPPGTEAITRLFVAAGGPVLLLFDEVLNFLNRHRAMAESFYAFLQNLTVAMTGITYGAAVISLPRSQVEMTPFDLEWQEKITKVVRRVAKDLIANDEAEISEVIRRRLFEDLGSEQVRKETARVFADWCFERRAQLPPEWTAVDTAATEAKAKEFLRRRFEACYPFHPATLSVFQRKWQALPQYQQTRGTLAMLAQWIAIAAQESFRKARPEPLITLGSAPLFDPGFRSTLLGQLGESRLVAAIEADIAGEHSHARALDADTKGPLRDIHYRVGTAILFESSGGQSQRVAHLPELRFALGEPGLDTTSIDTAAFALEDKSYFIRRIGTDGFQIYYRPTLKKVVNDRRASLDPETEVKPAMLKLIEDEFRRRADIPVLAFPPDGAEVGNTTKLTLVVLDPSIEWTGNGPLRARLAEWIRYQGRLPRLYPASLIWCLKKPGRDLREKVEVWLAWRRVAQEVAQGTLGEEFESDEIKEVKLKAAAAEEAAKEQVWADYRFLALADNQAPEGVKVIDLGAGHANSGETIAMRVVAALKSEGLLIESLGAGYLERKWPAAFKDEGAWPLTSLRQSFLDGSLPRLFDPDSLLRVKIAELVARGELGLAFGRRPDGTYERVWFDEYLAPEDIAFESDLFLLTKAKAQRLKSGTPPEGEFTPGTVVGPAPPPAPVSRPEPVPPSAPPPGPPAPPRTLRIAGNVPVEVWNRLGTRLLPKLKTPGVNLKGLAVELTITVDGTLAESLLVELRQTIEDLNLVGILNIWE